MTNRILVAKFTSAPLRQSLAFFLPIRLIHLLLVSLTCHRLHQHPRYGLSIGLRICQLHQIMYKVHLYSFVPLVVYIVIDIKTLIQ